MSDRFRNTAIHQLFSCVVVDEEELERIRGEPLLLSHVARTRYRARFALRRGHTAICQPKPRDTGYCFGLARLAAIACLRQSLSTNYPVS